MTKPSFAAPSQTLEKSLKEHIAAKRPPSSSSPPAAAGGGKSTGARPKKPGGSKRLSRESAKEPSPPTQPQQPDPKGLPITDEEKEKRLQRDAGGGGGVATEAAVEAVEVAPSAAAAEGEPSPSVTTSAGAGASSSRLLRQPTVDLLASEVARASLRPPEQRPFFDAVFQALDCADSDYVALFALCLFYAIQQNEGEFSIRGLWKSFLFGKLACTRWRRGKIPFFLLCGVPIRGRFSCKFFRLLIL